MGVVIYLVASLLVLENLQDLVVVVVDFNIGQLMPPVRKLVGLVGELDHVVDRELMGLDLGVVFVIVIGNHSLEPLSDSLLPDGIDLGPIGIDLGLGSLALRVHGMLIQTL